MKGSRPRRAVGNRLRLGCGRGLIVVPLAWRQELDRGVPRGYHIIDLGPFRPIAINNVGQIVGSPIDLTDQFVRGQMRPQEAWPSLGAGALDRPGRRDDLFVTPTDINDRGQVTGWYEVFLEPASQTVTPSGIQQRDARYSPPHAFRTATESADQSAGR